MRDLTEIRQRIDQIDQKMLALFKERMGCSAEVAEYKRGTGRQFMILFVKDRKLMP